MKSRLKLVPCTNRHIAITLFIVFQFIYLHSRFGWGFAKTAIIQMVSLAPQLLILFILSFLWFVALPAIAMIILLMAFGNRKL